MFFPAALLCLVAVTLVTRVCVWAARGSDRTSTRVVPAETSWIIVALWLACLAWAIVARILQRDWLKLFWSAQIPLTSLFLCSGVFLERIWRENDEPVGGDRSGARRDSLPMRHPGWCFLAMMVSVGIAPLVLQLAFPHQFPKPRDIGRPVSRLVDLAAWGFGAELPEFLLPMTNADAVRGVGYLPREVTVPMGILLVAAWCWIAFCALALLGRLVPSPHIRRAFLLLSPPLLGIASFLTANGEKPSSGWFDPRFFWPYASQQSGIWRSDPIVLRSFGPVLLTAVLCALLMPFALRIATRGAHGARARAPDASSASA